jgi:hypothetical protein
MRHDAPEIVRVVRRLVDLAGQESFTHAAESKGRHVEAAPAQATFSGLP